MMTHFVGLDVSQKMTAICVVDNAGRRVWRGQCPTAPEQIAAMVRRHAGDDFRIGIETGATTQMAVIFCETSKPTKWVIMIEPPMVRITGQRRPDRGTIGRSGAHRDYRMSTYGMVWRLCADHGRKQETGGDDSGKGIAGAALATAP